MMGQQHFDAMLKTAEHELRLTTPTILAMILPYRGVFSCYTDVFNASRLACGLHAIDRQFVSELNQLLADKKIWLYFHTRTGRKERSMQGSFDDILEEKHTDFLWELLSR